MPTTEQELRVLIVDDHRDTADSLGLLVEEFGHQVHVTYGGKQALDVAIAFRPDVMLVDLAMPDLDGCSLVRRLRESPAFAHTKIAAITGHKDEGHKTLAMKAGFDTVLFKPASPTEIKEVFASVVVSASGHSPKRGQARVRPGTAERLPIEDARRIRNERESKTLTRSESESAICEGIVRFQDEYLGWRSEQIHAHFIKTLLVVRIQGVLTRAEQQLSKSSSSEKGRDLIKQVRKQLLEQARPMMESMVHEITGVKALSMHHDISTVTGEEVVVFSLAELPRFES
jgi:DNA-binding response OmpR family regulator